MLVMGQELVRQVKQDLKPLIKDPSIAVVLLYGSAIRKEKPNDVDVLILLDDIGFGLKNLPSILTHIKELESNAKLKYHFQPPRPFTNWWALLLKGEPWILSSLKHSIVLKDKYNTIREAKTVIEALKQSAKEERADRLLERANEYLFNARAALIKALPLLLEAATEAFQLYLLFHGEVVVNKRKIADKMLEFKGFEHEASTYLELIDLQEKAEKGVLSEFTGENLDHYKNEVKAIINKVEKEILKQ